MNDGTIDVFTLIALIAAVVVALKLRSVLGQRTDDDDARIERRTREREFGDEDQSQSDNVVTLPTAHREHDETQPEVPEPTEEEIRAGIEKFANNDARLIEGLESIRSADSNFDPNHFIEGAKQAYEMIVTAFADGDLKALREFLSDDVYRSFEDAVKTREKDNLILDQTFIGITKSNVLEAEVSDGAANVVVRFGSEMITATRDKSGEVISGDPNEVEDITDIWTFSRDVSTARARANPNWKLVATQAPN